MNTICVLKRNEDSEKNDCRFHFHVKRVTAMQWTGRGKVEHYKDGTAPIRTAEWVGPRHIRILAGHWKIVRSGPYGLGYTQMVMIQ